jgi:DNA-binding protein Alba
MAESISNALTILSMDQTKANDLKKIKTTKDSVFMVKNMPVMESVLDALSIIGKHKEITIRARGNLISNAVTISLIITEKMLRGDSKIHKITVDSEPIQDLGESLSIIEIIIRKI